MPRIELAGESAFVQQPHYNPELFEKLQNFAEHQEARKRVYHLSNERTPDILREAASFTISRTSMHVNSVVIKRYDKNTNDKEYTFRRPMPSYVFGSIGITAVSLSNVTLMEVIGEDGDVHNIECLPNTAVIMKRRLENRVFAPQEEGPRHVVVIGYDITAGLRNWRQLGGKSTTRK